MTFFSDREGVRQQRDIFQINSVDDGLRNRLWNILHTYYLSKVNVQYWSSSSSNKPLKAIINHFYTNYLKLTVDDIPRSWPELYRDFKRRYMQGDWYVVYDVIQLFVDIDSYLVSQDSSYGYSNASKLVDFIESCNLVLEQEMSGWRFVDKRLARLTSPEEMQAVEESLSYKDVLEPVSTQLETALNLMSQRPNPNYRDSIKNSISAVGTVCKLIAKMPNANLGDALKAIGKSEHMQLHPSLKLGLEKIYGWTSNAQGIRHELMESDDLDFDDAKFMLVSCATFCNYLIGKAQKAGISFK